MWKVDISKVPQDLQESLTEYLNSFAEYLNKNIADGENPNLLWYDLIEDWESYDLEQWRDNYCNEGIKYSEILGEINTEKLFSLYQENRCKFSFLDEDFLPGSRYEAFCFVILLAIFKQALVKTNKLEAETVRIEKIVNHLEETKEGVFSKKEEF